MAVRIGCRQRSQTSILKQKRNSRYESYDHDGFNNRYKIESIGDRIIGCGNEHKKNNNNRIKLETIEEKKEEEEKIDTAIQLFPSIHLKDRVPISVKA